MAPVVKELEKELGALLPERWAQKVAEHGSAVREWSLRPLGDSLKLNLDDRNRTSTPSALPPLLRDLAKTKLGRAILAKSPLKLALGVAGWLFLALCFYRCCGNAPLSRARTSSICLRRAMAASPAALSAAT